MGLSSKNYSFLKKIGQGSYGEVWLVQPKDNEHKKFVLKKISFAKASEKEMNSARQECQLLKSLKHPNIVQYKDSFEEDNSLYIAMAFCEGGDLYTLLKERKGSLLSEKQIVEWLIQIAMALLYIHEKNILHRDLKTQNVFLTKSIIKIGDLGIAKQLGSKNDMAKTIIGTPYYMSPELFDKKPYNFKSDIWSLGCVTYEMATLKHAFNAKNYTALSYKILNGQTPDMPSKYSKELICLMQDMLNKVPDKRPSTDKILCNPFIRQHIQIFLGQSKKKIEKPEKLRKSSAKDIHHEHRGESNNSEEKFPVNISPELFGILDKCNDKHEVMSTSTLKNYNHDEYDDNDDVVVGHSSMDSHSKKSSISSQKENHGDSNKTDLEKELQKGLRNENNEIIVPPVALVNESLKRSKNFSYPNVVESKVKHEDILKETAIVSANVVARQRRRQEKRNQGFRTLRISNPNEDNIDYYEDDDNNSNDKRRRRRKNNSVNEAVGNAFALPELRRIDTPEEIINDFPCPDVLQVIEKMNETLNLKGNFENIKDSIIIYKAQMNPVNIEPVENEQETLDRSTFMNKRYQEIRKEIMKNVGYKKMSNCYDVLKDLSLNHEVQMQLILGDDYAKYCGKIIWLKMIEDN